MPELAPKSVATYLVVWNEEENTLTAYEEEDVNDYLDPKYKWENAFTIPHMNALNDMMNAFIMGCMPPAIPDWKCMKPLPIDNILRPAFMLRMIEVAYKVVGEKKKLLLVNIMELQGSSELIAEAIKEREEMAIRNKILGGIPQNIPQDQLQKMIQTGMIKPVNQPQQKPSGIILQ